MCLELNKSVDQITAEDVAKFTLSYAINDNSCDYMLLLATTHEPVAKLVIKVSHEGAISFQEIIYVEELHYNA